MSNTPKRFDEWEQVDCNDCSHYWDNSCDGVKAVIDAPRKLCTSFLPTRSVVIPLQIKSLITHLKWLYGGLILEAFVIFILVVKAFG
jgi:hypothetical protein